MSFIVTVMSSPFAVNQGPSDLGTRDCTHGILFLG
jgi:hypothetical protein